jgi:hypothetical protein
MKETASPSRICSEGGVVNVNPWKRDGSKSTLELDITFSFLLFLSLLKTQLDNVAEHFLHSFSTESLSQL